MNYKERIKRLEEIEGLLSSALPLDEALELYEEALEHFKELQHYYREMEERFDKITSEN